MDWIMEFGGSECIVAVHSGRDRPVRAYLAGQLMPLYPR
jgi:hypothetical protein